MQNYKKWDIVEIYYLDDDMDLIHLKWKIDKVLKEKYYISKIDDYENATSTFTKSIIFIDKIIKKIK